MYSTIVRGRTMTAVAAVSCCGGDFWHASWCARHGELYSFTGKHNVPAVRRKSYRHTLANNIQYVHTIR